MEGPKFSKRRKLGKNKKKSWRGIDITATEEFLEDQRFQERTTGLMAEKSNEQLFMVQRESKEDSAKEEVPRRKPTADLKCYSNLINRSMIRCPRKEDPVAVDFETKVLQRETRSVLAAKKNKSSGKTKQSRNLQDLWGEEEKGSDTEEYFNEITKRKRVQTPKHIKRISSGRPAVEITHPGTSVNPSYEDHQDLLLQAHLVEVRKEKAERRIFNALNAKFPSLSEAPTQETWMKEMSAGLFDGVSRSKRSIEGADRISINPAVNREKKKTRSERRKLKAAKLMEQQLQKKKQEKQRENEVFRIAKMCSELTRTRKAQKKKAQLKAKKMESKKYAPKKLGKIKFEMPDTELKLTSELVGSLRCLKPEGNLLEDRYKSLQHRNIIEPRVKVNKKKTKTKKFEKKSFREVTL